MISIITATYNRGFLLNRLYESLLVQTNYDFEWIIIDDGSIDNTKDIVKKFMEESKIKIKYYYQDNKGKHVALNLGIERSIGDLIFFVDSDDYLSNHCIKLLEDEWSKIKNIKVYAGISGSKVDFSGKMVGTSSKDCFNDVDSFDYRYRLKIKGDKAEAFRAEILKKNKFPFFKDEKFITEATLFNRIAEQGYILRWTNEPIYYCEYRDDGLTKMGGSNKFLNSWKGTTLYIKEYISYKKIPFFHRFYALLWYIKMGILNKKDLFIYWKDKNEFTR